MRRLKCMIVDDEPLAHKVIENYIGKMPGLNLISNCYTAFEALAELQKNNVDLLFLDIEMPEMKGISLLKVLQNKPAVIITTAFRDYAAEGYDYDVCDFLVKPFSFERFVRGIQRAEMFLNRDEQISRPLETAPVFIGSGKEMIRLDPGQVLFIEGLRDYLKVYTLSGCVIIRSTFDKLLTALPAGQFIRIHKSFAVAVQHIDKVKPAEVCIKQHKLPIGRHYKEGALLQLRQRTI